MLASVSGATFIVASVLAAIAFKVRSRREKTRRRLADNGPGPLTEIDTLKQVQTSNDSQEIANLKTKLSEKRKRHPRSRNPLKNTLKMRRVKDKAPDEIEMEESASSSGEDV